MDADEAKELLESYGIDPSCYSFEQVFDGTVPEGVVISSEVFEDDTKPAGFYMVVKVSTGEVVTDVKVPDIVGMSEEKAKQTLEDSGFVCNVEYQEMTKAEPGKVFSQSEEAGSLIPKGSEITIYVAGSGE
ncbi:MAG: PASTA domain-containing protein [Ruminococcus sp.]|nr:PASTA domain-containing protein [Ruminococcus sp.]